MIRLSSRPSPGTLPSGQRVTIRDVAREANVSVSTVSHVLSGKRPTSAATRQRVQTVVAALGYHPNAMAQSLVWRRSFAVGLVIPDITNPYYPALARGVEDAIRAAGYTLVLGNSDYDPERESTYLDLLRTHQLAGVIYCLSSEASPLKEPLRQAASEGLPVVIVHGQARGVTAVGPDNRQGGRLAAEHLIELGHRRLGLIGAEPHDESLRAREAGFREAVARAGLAADESAIPVEYGNHQIDGGLAAATRLLAEHPDVTGVFVLNDLMALGALEAARAAGRVVPDDLSIVGFDNIPFAELANPPLTTVAQPIRELGARAADLLLALVERQQGEGPPQPVPASPLLPNRLVVRGSTGPAPVAG